jgi:hypothetical protein
MINIVRDFGILMGQNTPLLLSVQQILSLDDHSCDYSMGDPSITGSGD